MNVFSFKYRNAILGVTATVIGYYAILSPHTVLLNKYRYIVARHQLDKEAPLNSKVQKMIRQVMDDMKLPDNVRDIIKSFSVTGFDPFHAGTLNVKYGAILGIPINFTTTEEDIRKNLQIRDEPIDWSRQDARIFLSSSMLSESAQKFAIANEILRIQAEEPYFNSTMLALIIAALWTLYNVIMYRYKLREHNIIMHRTLYLVFPCFGVITWFGIKDYHSYHLDGKHDEALCNLGPEYINGGQEFYEQMLLKNRALRSLLKEGKKIYTANGNIRSLLRQKHLPNSYRKDFFNSRLQNLNYKV